MLPVRNYYSFPRNVKKSATAEVLFSSLTYRNKLKESVLRDLFLLNMLLLCLQMRM